MYICLKSDEENKEDLKPMIFDQDSSDVIKKTEVVSYPRIYNGRDNDFVDRKSQNAVKNLQGG